MKLVNAKKYQTLYQIIGTEGALRLPTIYDTIHPNPIPQSLFSHLNGPWIYLR